MPQGYVSYLTTAQRSSKDKVGKQLFLITAAPAAYA